MALTSAQIIARACTIAKAPAYAVQAGQYLNMTLQTLCQTYDFDFAKETQTITLTSAQAYNLNENCLRTKEVFYSVGGIIFYLFAIPIETMHQLPTPNGVSNYPDRYSIDVSTTPNQLIFYPPPQISQTVTVNYFPEKADITTPESSSEIPWFTNQEYLIRKVAANLMLETDDDRQMAFEQSADQMLSKFLTMADDKEGYSQTIKLSRERFRKGNNHNPNKAFPFDG